MASAAQRKAIGDLQRERQVHAGAEREMSELLAEFSETAEPLEIRDLEARRERLIGIREEAAARLAEAKGRALGKGPGFDLLSARHPLLLLPVRLETRFAWTDAAGAQTFTSTPGAPVSLLIRIYPDEIHEDSHEPELTGNELVLLKELQRRLDAARDLKDLNEAWGDLIRQVGPRRAGWLGEVLARGAPPTRRPAAYSRPSVARLLPDAWVAIAELGDGSVKTAPSATVREPLETSMGDEWMVEFGAALKAGMAIEMTDLPVTEVRRLVVLGARGTLDPARTASALEELLDAHHYTDGLELLAPGTPTNSLPGSRAGYSSRPDLDDLLPVERRRFEIFMRPNPLCRPGVPSDGTELATALGIDVGTFGYVKRADATDQQDAMMIRSLLAGSTGRSLSRLLRDILDVNRVEEILAFGVGMVSAHGPLPTIGVGTQPYGVLPVLLRDDTRIPAESLAGQFLSVLDRLRTIWEEANSDVHSLVSPGPNPGETLIRILQQDAVVRRIAFRPMVGPEIGAQVAAAQRAPQTLDAERQAAAQAIEGLGATNALAAPLLDALNVDFAVPLTAPIVRPADAAPNSRQHPATYLEIAASLRTDYLLRHDYGGAERPRALLYSIARLAVLESADAAARAMHIDTGANPQLWDDEEVPRPAADPLGTPLRRLEYPLPIPPGGTAAFQLSLQGGGLDQARNVLRDLAQRPPELLEELLRGSLGLFSHRLDPWYTAFAVDRLRELRNDPASQSGLNVGGYGVVENLRPAARQSAGADGVYSNPLNGGYVHAPSANHGAAAAVLRSVHLAHEAAGHGEAFSVDLSSERVRRGLELLEGIRGGQSLSALLGYRIERQLAAEGLQKFIAPLRRVAPMVANKLTPSADPVESVAATNVVDGLSLLEDAGYDGEQAPSRAALWTNQPSLGPAPSRGDAAKLTRVLTAAADTLDAAADLSVAESVYQAVQGNPMRAGATVDGLSGAPVPPPEVGVMRTPSTGVGVTHRLLVLLGDPAGGGWAETPRAAAEPRLDAWARSTLPPPDQIGVRVRLVDTDGTELDVLDGLTIETLNAAAGPSLASLQVGALDFVLLAEPRDEPQRSALELRLMALAELVRPAAMEDASLELDFDRLDAWDADTFGLVEALEIARQLRDAISRGRPLAPEDLASLKADAPVAVNQNELEGRAQDAMGALAGAIAALTPLKTSTDTAAIRKALFRADLLGVAGAAPSTLRDTPGEKEPAPTQRAIELGELQAQVKATLAELARREDAAGKAPADDPGQRLAAVFGEGFTALPVLDNPATLSAPFEAAAAPDGATAAAARTLLSRVASARANARALDAALGYAEAVAQAEESDPPALHVGQLGGSPGERWVALPPDPGESVPGGRVSLVAATPGPELPDPAKAGLIVDEWVEVVPASELTTSVAFNYDAPGSTPPQVMLLGVPPQGHEAWTQQDALRIVEEALALARIRMVDLDDIPDLGQILPALVTEENSAGETIGLDVEALTKVGP